MAIVDFKKAEAGAVRTDIHCHDRDVAFGQLSEQWLFNAERHNCDAFGIALKHAADAERHSVGIVVGGTDQNLISAFYCDLFKSLNQLREKRVGDLRDDEAKQPASTGYQATSLRIGKVVQLIDRFPHTSGQLRVYSWNVIDGAGHVGNGHSSPLGHGIDV